MNSVTRELKLALIVGFSLVLVVTVLISDHLSKARNTALAGVSSMQPGLTARPVVEQEPLVIAPPPVLPEPTGQRRLADAGAPRPLADVETVPTTPGRPEVVTVEQGRGSRSLAQNDPRSTEITGTPQLPVTSEPAVPSTEVPPPVADASGDKSHTVVSGDSLYKLAKHYYGDGSKWKRIAEANTDKIKGDSLRQGAVLRIPVETTLTVFEPPVAPKTAAGKKPSSKAKSRTYTVRKGDTLNEISRRELGSAGRTDELMRLNELEDEDTVQIGMVLKLPQ